MKALYIIICIVILSGKTVYSQSMDRNYIKSVDPLIPCTDVSEDELEALVTVKYYDGLGRLEQTVQRGINPGVYDVVNYVQYGFKGLPVKEWLPVPVNGDQGNYVPFTQVKAAGISFYGDDNPFSETVYERSLLNREVEKIGPGKAWRNAGISGNHSRKTEYLFNTASGELSVRNYRFTSSLKNNGNYPADVLTAVKSEDENGNVSYEFTDKSGRLILFRQINGNDWCDTYYIYDTAGRLRYVLPPQASDMTSEEKSYNMAQLAPHVYKHVYDSRGRRNTFQPPGCEPIYYIYNKLGRTVLSQTGNQRLTNEWSFTKYDIQGRAVLMGLVHT
ncbi:MAG: DUF6443 domain-containing protein, partial [Barnesiella sp.]